LFAFFCLSATFITLTTLLVDAVPVAVGTASAAVAISEVMFVGVKTIKVYFIK
jgi:uridine phosphorylase